jgi:four helix bundle protein
MSSPNEPFHSLENLQVYKLAREFRKRMYGVARRLPEIEKYGLASQIRRAAVSLTNNIAEGHGRHHFLDQLRFLVQARGSLEEMADDLNVCLDENYLPSSEIQDLKQMGAQVQRVINGYGGYLKKRKEEGSTLHESSVQYTAERAGCQAEDDLDEYGF